jgi:hypothetical protein
VREHIFFPGGRHLLFAYHLASAAVRASQPQNIVAAETRNRSLDYSRAAGSFAQLQGEDGVDTCSLSSAWTRSRASDEPSQHVIACSVIT